MVRQSNTYFKKYLKYPFEDIVQHKLGEKSNPFQRPLPIIAPSERQIISNAIAWHNTEHGDGQTEIPPKQAHKLELGILGAQRIAQEAEPA